MKTTGPGTLIICLILLHACEVNSNEIDQENKSDPDTTLSDSRIYYNSFEESSDTAGWKGGVYLYDEAPENGGQKSLFVSGGCIVPHVYFDFDPLPEDCRLIVKCWGKNLDAGGGLMLSSGLNAQISISISETGWTSYESVDTLFCAANSDLRLELMSGGFVPSSMLVDLIEIFKVK